MGWTTFTLFSYAPYQVQSFRSDLCPAPSLFVLVLHIAQALIRWEEDSSDGRPDSGAFAALALLLRFLISFSCPSLE